MQKSLPLISALLIINLLTACSQTQLDRLKRVGEKPPMEAIASDPEGFSSAPVYWPNKRAIAVAPNTVNSLWQPGAKSFFGDMRARTAGDILKVRIEIQDRAELDNRTERIRQNINTMNVPSLFGLRDNITNLVPGTAQGNASLIDINGQMNENGEGIIEREERIETEVAAAITQVLPNGNLVIYGSQEIRVNFEVRQLTIHGVVNPVDISPDNMVDLSRIAEARVSYGGKGLITDIQQPRIGNQIIDILSPW